jgi:hypothetical protein
MVYLTTFLGSFHFSRPLRDEELAFLTSFSGNRRMKLDVKQLEERFGGAHAPPKKGYGPEGAFFSGPLAFGDPAILDSNTPPPGVPSRHCHWTATRRKLKWNGEESFHHFIDWLEYMIREFLDDWGIGLDGAMQWQGEDPTDRGTISVWRSHVHVHADRLDSDEESYEDVEQ